MQTYRLKLLAIIFCFAMVVGMTPTIVFAQGIDNLPYNSMTSIDNESDDDEDEGIIIGGEIPSQTHKQNRKNTVVTTGTRLTGVNKAVYDSLKSQITKVANGTITSTQFSVSLSTMGLENKKWTASEIGVSAIVKNNQLTDEAYHALIETIGFDLDLVHNALFSDCTLELYWYDFETGIVPTGLRAVASKEGSEYKIHFETGLTVKFPVSQDYAQSTYNVNSSKIARVNKAIQKAKNIVDSVKNKSDYEKLVYYRDAICNAVKFDENTDNETTPYGDPWQLISVFDDDSSTNVADAGYSRAFKYLCDLTKFNGDVSCITVDGNIGIGSSGDTYHLWNIVKMDDGKNYLVDLIFCDMDDLEDRDSLFLVGYSSGSVNSGYVITYKTATVYYSYDEYAKKTFANEELTLSSKNFRDCGDNLTWSFEGNTLSISGSGKMYDWNYNATAPWYGLRNIIKNVVFEGNITHIGAYSFYYCNISSITIPDSVTSIGVSAFSSSALTSITIPDSVVSIGSYAFSWCPLKTAILPKNLTSIPYGLFNVCSSLTNITIPNSVTSIGDNAFANCKSLKSIVIPENVKTIGAYAFCYCDNLSDITIPNSVNKIGYSAFWNCPALTKILIPSSVTSIDANAFEGCTKLSYVVLNKSAYSEGAFPNLPADIFHYYYAISYTCTGKGNITGKSNTYGTDIIELTVSHNDDYILSQITWSDGNKTIELKPDKNGKYVMPDSENDVVINASFKKLWTITISETENGKVTVKNPTAYTGDDIKLNITPNTGYEVEKITVNGNENDGTNFTMPDSDVTVSVTFKKSVYTVSSTQIGDGTVELSKTTACYKDEVTITATPANGNKLAYIKVNDEIIQGNVFEMPAKNTSIEVAFAKDHKLTSVPAVKPTCTEDGNVAYYECQDPGCKCGLKYSDKYGLYEIENIIDPATGHSIEKVEAKAATCTETGHNEHWKCTKCGCLFSDSEGKNAIEAKDTVTEALGHDLEHVDAKAETYQKDGHIEHYFCKRENCGKKFADPDAKTELKDEDIIIPRKGAAVLDEEATVGNFIYKVTNPATDGTGTVTLIGVETRTTSVSIPGAVEIKESFYNVNRIGPKAFYGNKTIKTLSIGPKVVIIDANAFYGCSNLTKVSGGKALKTIGISAFARCTKLKSFSISSPVLSKIGSYAFNKDKKLKTLNIKYTTKLTKSGVKKSLKGSKIKTVKVKKSKVKAYKKIFKKKNSGRTVRVKK